MRLARLDIGRTGDHHHAVAQGFTTGFIKKWNVCERKIREMLAVACPPSNAPLPANPGMENQFERLLFGGVPERFIAPECLPIQVAVAGKDAESEFG